MSFLMKTLRDYKLQSTKALVFLVQIQFLVHILSIPKLYAT